MPLPAFILRPALALALLGILGCSSQVHLPYEADTVKPYVPSNYQAVERIPRDVRRVVVLPVAHAVSDADYLPAFDQAALAELGRCNRFEIVPVSRGALIKRWGRSQFDSTSALPIDFLEVLKREYAADAVLFCDLTVYQPSPPIRTGWRLKLVRFNEQSMLWSFDEVFDAGRPEMARAAKQSAAGAPTKEFPLDRRGSILISPNGFARYGLEAAFSTLPPR